VLDGRLVVDLKLVNVFIVKKNIKIEFGIYILPHLHFIKCIKIGKCKPNHLEIKTNKELYEIF
jgi:hypothetical protein